MNFLTGDKNLDMMILMQLNDNELGKVCQVNKYVNSLCENDIFWMNRFLKRYSIDTTEASSFRSYLNMNWKELYRYFKQFKLKHIPIILRFLRDPTYVDRLIEELIKPNLPRWVNKNLLIQDFRKDFIVDLVDKNNFTDTKRHLINSMNPFVDNAVSIMYSQWEDSRSFRKLPK